MVQIGRSGFHPTLRVRSNRLVQLPVEIKPLKNDDFVAILGAGGYRGTSLLRNTEPPRITIGP